MKLPLILLLISFLCLTAILALSVSLSKHGCPEKCGNVTIPYPFGIGSRCSANSSFTVICQNSTSPPRPILSSIYLEILEIHLDGTIVVNQSVTPLNCSQNWTLHTLPIPLLGSPFTISATYNTVVNLGCRNLIWLPTTRTPYGGCKTIFDANSTGVCSSGSCCKITIPQRLQRLRFTYLSVPASNDSFCGYAFPVETEWLRLNYGNHKGLQNDLPISFDKDIGFAPLVLEWEAYNLVHLSPYSDCTNFTQEFSPIFDLCADGVDVSFNSASDLDNYFTLYESTAMSCFCLTGNPYLGQRSQKGNPYLPGGCPVDDCNHSSLCAHSYDYGSSSGTQTPIKSSGIGIRMKITFIVIGTMVGALILFYGAWRSGEAITKLMTAIRRYEFYKRNGGLLLEQHLASTEKGLEKIKLFTSKELSQATDHYNENRILGRGGQGTVYKGMLADGKIVAVKKSKRVDEGDLESFINEIVILSQINHRNVVRLLGCCLETEVPLLVYEFIPNGTLFHHIHEPNEELPLTWEMRVRIATEVAGALAYLHSASSVPIYHRDIKSKNILLDDKYRAKVSDFGISRSIAIDETHVTTRVLGTFGYLDPEYFQSSHFTEKSDVYSFGVVMVELLTGEKAVTAVRAESGKSLAMHFLHSMEDNQLFNILDACVPSEDKVEEIVAIAKLAARCMDWNGRRRPTMKEVAICLEGIRNKDEVCHQYHDHNMDDHSVELFDESSNFSSISESVPIQSLVTH